MGNKIYVKINNNDEYPIIQEILYRLGYVWTSERCLNMPVMGYLDKCFDDELLQIKIDDGTLIRYCDDGSINYITFDVFLDYIESGLIPKYEDNGLIPAEL